MSQIMLRTLVFALLLSLAGDAGVAHAQSADEVARANNPLAPITAINFQNYAHSIHLRC